MVRSLVFSILILSIFITGCLAPIPPQSSEAFSNASIAVTSNRPGTAADAALPQPILREGASIEFLIRQHDRDHEYTLNLTTESTGETVRGDGAVVEALMISADSVRTNQDGVDIGKWDPWLEDHYPHFDRYPEVTYALDLEGPRYLHLRPEGNPRDDENFSGARYTRVQEYPQDRDIGFLPRIEPVAFLWLPPMHHGFANVDLKVDQYHFTQSVFHGGDHIHVEIGIVGRFVDATAHLWYTPSSPIPTHGTLEYMATWYGVQVPHSWSFETLAFDQGTGPQIAFVPWKDKVVPLPVQRDHHSIGFTPLIKVDHIGGLPEPWASDLDAAVKNAMIQDNDLLQFGIKHRELVIGTYKWLRYAFPALYLDNGEVHEVPPRGNEEWRIYFGARIPEEGLFVERQEIFMRVNETLGERVYLTRGPTFPSTYVSHGFPALGEDHAVVPLKAIHERFKDAPGMEREIDVVAWHSMPYTGQVTPADRWELATGCNPYNEATHSSFIRVDPRTGLLQYAWFDEQYGQWTRCQAGLAIPPIPGS
jgi:hypothetical protein